MAEPERGDAALECLGVRLGHDPLPPRRLPPVTTSQDTMAEPGRERTAEGWRRADQVSGCRAFQLAA